MISLCKTFTISVKYAVPLAKNKPLGRQTDGLPYFTDIKLMNSVWNTRHHSRNFKSSWSFYTEPINFTRYSVL